MRFGYDANGRMVKSTKTSQPDANSVYDAAGMRVAECVNNVWRLLVYDVGGKLIAEYGGPEQTGAGGLSYVMQDWQGSTRVVTNAHGFVKSRNDYTAFGEDIGSGTGLRTENQGFGSSDSLRQKYGLTERDDATGLDHTWFRKHETQAGRWTSPDPYNGSMNIGDPQSFNRYSYVVNQPTNYIDPSGLNTVTFTMTVCPFWERPEDRVCYEIVIHTMEVGGGGDGGGTDIGGGGGNDEHLDKDILNLCLGALYKEKGKDLQAALFTLPIQDTESNGSEPRFIGGSLVLSNTNFRGNSSSRNEEFMSVFRGEITTVVHLDVGNGDIGGAILPSSSSNVNIRPVDFIADPIAATLIALGTALSFSGIGDKNRDPVALWDCYRTNLELREKLKK